jgi:hypothetical protein
MIGGPGRDRTDDLFHAIYPLLRDTTTSSGLKVVSRVFMPATQVEITGKNRGELSSVAQPLSVPSERAEADGLWETIRLGVRVRENAIEDASRGALI